MQPTLTLKTLLTASLCALLVPGAATAESINWKEGETGTSFTCPDMEVENTPGASGNQTLFFPEDGCATTFTLTTAGRVLTVEFYVGGAATVCGHFEFRGASVGESSPSCATNGGKITATVTASVGSGTSLTVEWQTDFGTTIGADAYLDRFSWT